ncbi:hypothetical protein, partial [Candidatus Solincola sp.]
GNRLEGTRARAPGQALPSFSRVDIPEGRAIAYLPSPEEGKQSLVLEGENLHRVVGFTTGDHFRAKLNVKPGHYLIPMEFLNLWMEECKNRGDVFTM